MKKYIYQHGASGVYWGIYNNSKKEFQFGIYEDTPMLAVARLFQIIGENARKWKFEPKKLPHELVTKYKQTKITGIVIDPCNVRLNIAGQEHKFYIGDSSSSNLVFPHTDQPPTIKRKFTLIEY